MAIKTFPSQERYSKNRGGETEPKKKLKKLRSVKVANLDRLRLSMRREKSRFNRKLEWDDATDPSETSSTTMSESSSPNYMKATTSFSAKKGSSEKSSGNHQFSSPNNSGSRTPRRKKNDPSSTEKTTSKFNVEKSSDPVDVNIPVDNEAGKTLKRVSSIRRSKKLSSMKSIKFRTKYSQFPEFNDGIVNGQMKLEDISEDLIDNAANDMDSTVKAGAILQRSRSIKLTRLRSIRSSRRRPKSRLGVGATMQMSHEAGMSNAEPRYMKGTSSQEARKNSAKGLTRTSSLRPLRILAKIPSLRPRRSKVKKPPEVTPQSDTSVDRATCSSTLKSAKVPSHREPHSGSHDVCPYTYCSFHSHHNHAPSPPLKEFISAKRQMFNNQKGKQLESQCREEVQHSTSVTETDHSTQTVAAECPVTEAMTNSRTANAPDVQDTEVDFFIRIYAKPRKKWALEGTPSDEAEALEGSVSNSINARDYCWKLAEMLGEASRPEARQEALNEGQLESDQMLNLCNIEADDKTHQHTTKTAVSSSTLALPHNDPDSVSVDEALGVCIGEQVIQSSLKNALLLPGGDSEVSPRGNMINILSDKKKYTSIWQLIYQQSVSSEASMVGNQGVNVADEREFGDANTCQEMNFNLRQSKCHTNLNEDEDNQSVAMDKFEFDQSAAIKLVQEALNAILRGEQPSAQQSVTCQEMPCTADGEHIFTPADSTEEKFREGGKIVENETRLESEDNLQSMGHTGAALQQKVESKEGKMLERKISNGYSKLRKLMMTAKFISAMERLRKISPRKPQYLSSEQTSEEERVYLRHQSMNGRKNDEEWMLNHALRQVISRLNPDQHRRVALLVEAFETLTPEQKEKGTRFFPVKGEPAPGIESANSMNGEPDQTVEAEQEVSISHELVPQKQDVEVSLSPKGVLEVKSLTEDHDCEARAAGYDAPRDKIQQDFDKAEISLSTLESSRSISRPNSINPAFEEPCMETGGSMRHLEISSQFSAEDYGHSDDGHMTNILFDKQKYTSMWSLIYQHVQSSEVPMDEDNRVDGFDEKEQGHQMLNEPNSTQSSSDTNCKEMEDDNNQSAACGKHELDQSAALKLVKEAVYAILQCYEQPPDQESIPDNDKAAKDDGELCNSSATNSREEQPKEESKRQEKHTLSEHKDKLHQVEKTSEEFQQVGPNELKAPQRKMSKSFSKLKKAFVTAKFIKAMERMRKNGPQKSRHLHTEAAPGEERVYLRHLSMNGRKNHEEWMLDFALKQVISKLAPDQQRRVALLVEAYETLTPEEKQKSVRCYPSKGQPAPCIKLANPTLNATEQFVGSEKARSMSDKHVPEKQEDGFVLSSKGTPEEITLHEDHDHQENAAVENVQQKTDNTAVSDSTSELSENNSISASVDVALEDPSAEDEETMSIVQVPSQSPSGDSGVSFVGDMTTILSDKQKYNSMWNLIYQHVRSSEASIAGSGKQGENEVDEDKQSNDANKCKDKNDQDSIQSSNNTNQKEDEYNQSAAYEKCESDQLAAIKLVKEALSEILKCHEHRSDKQSLSSPDMAACNRGRLCYSTDPASTEENPRGVMRVEGHKSSEPEDKLQTEEKTSASLRRKVELKTSEPNISKSYSKLKKVIATAKFIKAMEKLRRISPRQPQYLSPEVAAEEERVQLRHHKTSNMRNDEEWMLDYALRKVISDLAPAQQRRVALLLEAFEAVTPEQKHNGIRSQMTDQPTASIAKPDHHDSSSYEDDICPNHDNKFSQFSVVAPLRSSLQEDHSIEISNFRKQLHDGVIEGNHLHIHLHLSPKVTKEDTDSKPMSELLQPDCLSKEPEQESEAKTAKGVFSDTQRHTTMWNLIYQHAKTVTAAEAGSKLGERMANKYQMTRGYALSETTADADGDDSDASSVASELTESEATKLVKDAIQDILDAPQEQDNELASSNITAVSEEDQRAVAGEKPEKSLSRGYSNLRKLIICKKFIRAMEKTKKSDQQKHKNLVLDSDSAAKKAHLKPRAVSEKKNTDHWMLDNVLQKVVAGLAPTQQRRVAMLVKAFEKVNPDLEETGKGYCGIQTDSIDGISSAGNAKEKDQVFDPSQKSNGLPGGFVMVEEPAVTSSREAFTNRVPLENYEDTTPSLSIEHEVSRQYWRCNDPSSTTAATSDTIGTLSDLCKEAVEVNCTEMPSSSVVLEERSSAGEELVGYSRPDTESAANSSQPEELEDELEASADNSLPFNRQNFTNLWCLLAQHINSDVPEKMENETPCEIDVIAQDDSANVSLQRKNDDYDHLSPDVNHDSGMEVHIRKSKSFEFQEKEAIKLVQEAVDEILLLPEKTCDDQTMSIGASSDQVVCNKNHGYAGEPSSDKATFADVETLQDPAATHQEKNMSLKEDSPNSYSQLSKVLLCKRFIKAMDKMRKIKPQNPQYHAQQLQSEARSSHSMRQIATGEQKSWEEWMLDHAMQQVVGKLAPVQKKKVALLVQAFETVSSQPNPLPAT